MHGDVGGASAVTAPGAEREFKVDYLTRSRARGRSSSASAAPRSSRLG